ncbi:MAG: (d)CMP kinase [Lachnospiraceae bacterium]|nr:(d)CMP kinase [Lachnospiraceae bacterium]
MGMNVAIDGPAGAGKSTIAKEVAKELGYIYVDTGAMYRAIALYLIRNGVKAEENELISEKCKEADVTIEYVDGKQVVFLNGEDVNGFIRTEEVGSMASSSSTNQDVRKRLLGLQRELAEKNDVIMDGRDIGTNILPNAQAKIYLTASIEVRAKRRYDELVAKGMECDYEEIKKEIAIRDERDMNREIAPLRQAKDAVLLDSSELSVEEVKERMIQIIKSKIEK